MYWFVINSYRVQYDSGEVRLKYMRIVWALPPHHESPVQWAHSVSVSPERYSTTVQATHLPRTFRFCHLRTSDEWLHGARIRNREYNEAYEFRTAR